MEKDIYAKLFELKAKGITLTRDTKAFNYKYATLDQIQSKLGGFLQKLKLVIVHQIKDNKVITDIRDIESNTFVTSEIEMTTLKAQDKGSEITYFRRYNLLSLLDLEVEDDDGKQAQDNIPKEEVEVKWYNDVDKNIGKWEDMITEGETTPQDIINKIEGNGYRINKANKEKILKLGY